MGGSGCRVPSWGGGRGLVCRRGGAGGVGEGGGRGGGRESDSVSVVIWVFVIAFVFVSCWVGYLGYVGG